MDKHYLSPDDITAALVHLWCMDFLDYKGEHRERSRVGLSLAILMYCFTSARTGEVHESTARRACARRANTRGNKIQRSGNDDPATKGRDTGAADRNLSAEVLAACYKVCNVIPVCIVVAADLLPGSILSCPFRWLRAA